MIGRQTGWGKEPVSSRRWGLLPSASIINRPPALKAIFAPSGDQAGWLSLSGLVVRLVSLPGGPATVRT